MHRAQPPWEVHGWPQGALPGSHNCLFLASGLSCLPPQGRPLPLLTSRILTLSRKVGLQEPQHGLPMPHTSEYRWRSQTQSREKKYFNVSRQGQGGCGQEWFVRCLLSIKVQSLESGPPPSLPMLIDTTPCVFAGEVLPTKTAVTH